jgi:cytochrome c biogenesis protein CcmG/thiol:disulfide interchange protein DsbE
MKNWNIPIVLIIVCFAAYLVARHHQRTNLSGTGSRPGQLAPEFSLNELSGRPIHLGDYRGKVVLLNFWATWCEPCRHEIPEFIRLQNNLPKLQILGISLDDSEKPVHTFYTEFKMNYPVVIGDAALASRYGGILGLPVTFLIGCDGRISAKHIGEVEIPEVTQEIAVLLKSVACTEA